MRKDYLPLSVVCLLLSFLLLPVVKAGNNGPVKTVRTIRIATVSPSIAVAPSKFIFASGGKHKADAREKAKKESIESFSNLLYDSLRLRRLGLSKAALLYAYEGQQSLARKGRLNNTSILTVCDFSQSSSSKRMYIIDIRRFKVLLTTYVAHGRNSGLKYASRFSNKPESLQSSLGFFVTRNVYEGKNGLSLVLAGQERGINDNAEERALVVHGADYIEPAHSGSCMGRSFGCPAVPVSQVSRVINLIKQGTCLFIYYPSKKYLKESKILNG